MAYPTDFSNVSATDTITASRNNAITKKIGLTAIDTTDAANPIGHLSIPTLAGTPAGTPANGVGSLVWNSSANSLHVNTTGTTWAEIGGGGSAAFTEAVTIDLSSGVGLTISQTGTGNVLDLVSVDSTNATKTPYVKIDRNAFFKLQYWAGDVGGTGKVFEIVKEGGITPFLVKNDGDVGIYHRLSSVNASEMRILNNSFGAVGNISLSGISIGNTWPGAYPVAGGITGPADHDMFIYPHGTGTLTLGGSTTTESTNIIDAQIPMQIVVNDAGAALSVRQAGAGKTFDLRMAAVGVFSELSFFSVESARLAETTTHFDSGPTNYPNHFKIYPSYMTGGGSAFEVLAKSSNSLFDISTTNTVGTISFGANATVSVVVPANNWKWNNGFTLSDIGGRGVTFINETYDSVARSTALHLDTGGAGEGDLVILDDSDNQLALFKYSGQVVLGTPSLATGATIGFPYMPAMAGAPSGTPTAITGSCAFHYDTTNNDLYVYNPTGTPAWKSVSLS